MNSAARKQTPSARAKLTILIADDDRDTVDTLAALLTDEGHTVHAVTNGALVEEAVRRLTPQACILDIEMPGKNGYALVQDILARADANRPLMIAISGIWKSTTDKMLAQVVGFDYFFAKPADPAQLIDVLAAYGSPPEAA